MATTTTEEQALFKGDANQQMDQTKEAQTKAWQLEQETDEKILEAQEASAEVLAEQQAEQTASDSPSPVTQAVDEAKREAKVEAVEHVAGKVKDAIDSKSPAVEKANLQFSDELLKDAKALFDEGKEAVKHALEGIFSKMGGGK